MRHDWDRLYYAIVEERVVNGYTSLKVIATGEDKLSTKRKSTESIPYSVGNRFTYVEAYMRMLERLEIGGTVCFGSWHSEWRLVYMDAKTYIYGNMLGFENIRFGYEPLLETPVLIYLGHIKFTFRHCKPTITKNYKHKKKSINTSSPST